MDCIRNKQIYGRTLFVTVRDAEAAGSNPVASILGRGTGNRLDKGFPVLLFLSVTNPYRSFVTNFA